MVECAIFDMDGVIIDSEMLHAQKNTIIFNELGIEVPDNFRRRLPGLSSFKKWEILKNMFNLKQEVNELVEIDRSSYQEFLKNEIHLLKPIEGIPELLEDLKGNNIKIALASSSPMDIIELVINSFKLGKYFDILVTGDCVERCKPDPDIFIYAAGKMNTAPENCVVIEDSGNGVRAAKSAGMKCIGYRNLNSGNQDLSPADIIVDSIRNVSYKSIEALF
jgi:haloacid dehalogenase superfamily, subfamily IA, variant 3 with third motif having DD or ED/haloacid dehalogenase superfamily, subfamily IA, variant 1 with third motif having Dx(3-4)D or Dx(3-4)E